MGSLVCPCYWCCYSRAVVRRLHWAALSSQREWVWQLTQFAARKRRSGVNRIGHPDWVKLSVELNCAPNQNTKFSLPLQMHKKTSPPKRKKRKIYDLVSSFSSRSSPYILKELLQKIASDSKIIANQVIYLYHDTHKKIMNK